MNITISVKTDTRGIEQLIANCENITPQIVEEAGNKCVTAAKIFAPVDTGALRSGLESIMVEELLARIATDVNYDIYQELGTYKMAAQPFLSPAAEYVAAQYLSGQNWVRLLP
jgi:hypothetical protein